METDVGSVVLFLPGCDASNGGVSVQLEVEGAGYITMVGNGEHSGKEDIGTADVLRQVHDPEGMKGF